MKKLILISLLVVFYNCEKVYYQREYKKCNKICSQNSLLCYAVAYDIKDGNRVIQCGLYESECQYRCFDASLTRETQWEIGKNNGCFASGCNASRRRESDSKEQWDFDD
ncbi:MAG: hypothetical protein KBA66_15520 [Leptospiraceae bacterium]|nr:hypothetical protein [Leptospiraceae bacterium]